MSKRFTQQIRETIADKIDALAKYSVYSYKRENIQADQLPAVIVTITGGVYEDGAETVDVDVIIEIIDKGSKIENILDDHAENYIEPLFPIGNPLDGLVEYMKPMSFSYQTDSETALGSIILNYNINYDKD